MKWLPVACSLLITSAAGAVDNDELDEKVLVQNPDPAAGGALRDVKRTSDGAFLVETGCGGCLIDISVRRWLAADDPRAREDVDVAIAFVDGPTDSARFYHPDAKPGAIVGFDVVVTLEPTTGFVVERHASIFGRVDAKGGFERLSWAEYVCAIGFATCDEGIVDLHLPSRPPSQALIDEILATDAKETGGGR